MFHHQHKEQEAEGLPISSQLARAGDVSDRPAATPCFSQVIVTSRKKKVIGGLRLHPDNFYARVKNTTGVHGM